MNIWNILPNEVVEVDTVIQLEMASVGVDAMMTQCCRRVQLADGQSALASS